MKIKKFIKENYIKLIILILCFVLFVLGLSKSCKKTKADEMAYEGFYVDDYFIDLWLTGDVTSGLLPSVMTYNGFGRLNENTIYAITYETDTSQSLGDSTIGDGLKWYKRMTGYNRSFFLVLMRGDYLTTSVYFVNSITSTGTIQYEDVTNSPYNNNMTLREHYLTNNNALGHLLWRYLDIYSTYKSDLDYSSGYNAGFSDGLDISSDEAYERGFTAGLNSSSANNIPIMIGTILSAPVNLLSSMFNVDFLGINLATLFFGLITFMIGIWVVKHFV